MSYNNTMDKVVDLTKILEKTGNDVEEKVSQKPADNKTTNPIFKKLAKFKNDNLPKKFDINDLLR